MRAAGPGTGPAPGHDDSARWVTSVVRRTGGEPGQGAGIAE